MPVDVIIATLLQYKTWNWLALAIFIGNESCINQRVSHMFKAVLLNGVKAWDELHVNITHRNNLTYFVFAP